MRDEALRIRATDGNGSLRHPASSFERAVRLLRDACCGARPTEGAACARRDDRDVVSFAFELEYLVLHEVPGGITLEGRVARRDDCDAHAADSLPQLSSG